MVTQTTECDALQPPRGPARDTLRAMLRRQPYMVECSVGVGNLLAALAPFVALGAVFGAITLAITPRVDPVLVVIVMAQPFGWAHVAGVRNRWLALAAAGTAGWVVAATVAALLPDADWARLIGVCAGTLAASAPYAFVTKIGTRLPNRR